MSRLHVCVDVARSPLDIWTVNGLLAGVIPRTGAVVIRKRIVALESNIAQFLRSATSMSTVSRSGLAAKAYWGPQIVGMGKYRGP